ncbi:DNA-binding HxlR family transcriptional regulator [Kitasatospora sp. MAP12-15]|uniref:winged helix-turn-helix transcriptional regulator n=1 Tax=unclassified Kitasatospora TaxID=2633591 RepID=UPI002473C42C|nr:winged helix-turn-helix transcriptional regulator [Kitasatospora sp. MAP12-44]MDH6111343.1 DNA-binding HxlR family transcriptional regulator [Kitasatospora sp. MAP12-44]
MPAAPAVSPRPVRDQAHQAGPIQRSVELVSPRWSVWVLQSLAGADAMRHADLQAALPMVNDTTLHRRLQQMDEAGLVHRSRQGRTNSYALTGAGKALEPVLDTLWDWGRLHQGTHQPKARAQVIEEALAPLSYSFATDILLELEHGEAYWSDILQVLPAGSAGHRVAALEQQGLVARDGEPRNQRYHLTSAGRALEPFFDAAEDWAHAHLPGAPRPPAASPAMAAALAASRPAASPAPTEQRAEASRAQAARLRSATSRLVFSHQPEPQPAPLIISAAPARQR